MFYAQKKNKINTFLSMASLVALIFTSNALCTPNILMEDKQIQLSSKCYKIVIDKPSGAVTSIIYRNQDGEKAILPQSGPEDGLACYVISPDSNLPVFAQMKNDGEIKTTKGKTEYGDFVQLEIPLAFYEKSYSDFLEPTITYRLYDQFVEFDFNFYFTDNFSSSVELGAGQTAHNNQWQKIFFPSMFGSADIFEPDKMEPDKDYVGQTVSKEGLLKYGGAVWDISEYRGVIRYPYGINESKDGFLIWGNLDLNSFAVLSTNHNDRGPALLATPKRFQKDCSYSFKFIYKYFSKADYDFTDVCRWYSENLYSSHPLSEGKVRLPKDIKPRTISTGNLFGSCYTAGATVPAEFNTFTSEKIKAIDDAIAETNGIHLWWDCFSWDHTYPVDGTWVTSYGAGWLMDRDKLKQSVKRHHDLGHQLYAYLTTLGPQASFSDEYPRYKSWQLSTKPGTYFVYPAGPMAAEELDVDELVVPEAWKKHAVAEKGSAGGVHADMCNSEYREWFTNRLKRFFSTFDKIDGIAWDYGWDAHCAPCIVHPNTGPHHGNVVLFHDMYNWLEENYPKKRIVNNMYVGCPTQLYCHAIMFEGCPQITKRSVESIKFYRTAMVGYYYYWQFKSVFKDKWKAEWERRILRNLSYGVTFAMGNVTEYLASEHYRKSIENITDFSALANNTPLVIENRAIKLSPDNEDITASFWGSEKRSLLALYNDSKEDIKVILEIDKNMVQIYQISKYPKVFNMINRKGEKVEKCDFNASQNTADNYAIEGTLPAGYLLLAQ